MRIAILSWRDSTHPEGGGAEHYIETVAEHLVARGHTVTMFCAAHGDAPRTEMRGGVTIVRAGGRVSVYPAALRALRRAQSSGQGFDVVVDVQNGVPFFAAKGIDLPVVLLCHHVHREQWPVVFGPVASRLGWFIESSIAPWANRAAPYVAVSDRTKEELVALGVGESSITVIHNGTDEPRALGVERSPDPTVVVLGRNPKP